MIAAHTYDIIVQYHDGVLSVSKWVFWAIFFFAIALVSK